MDDRKRLLAIALKLLSSRPRSSAEVKTRLLQKSANSELVNQIIADLTHQKLLDDAQFASWYVESRSRSRPRSRKLLELELKSRGVSAEILPDSTDYELALAAFTKKKRIWANLSVPELKPKASRFLASRGFSWEIINKVLKLV